MRVFKFILMNLCLMGIFSTNVRAEDALSFTKTNYEILGTYKISAPDFADKSVALFKSQFAFDEFFHRTIADFESQLNDEQKRKLNEQFNSVFFKNLFDRSQKIFARRIQNPTYSEKVSADGFSVIKLTGSTAEKPDASMAFYAKQKPDKVWVFIDLEIESVQLSRNYRGAFNRIFREQGFDGLLNRIAEKL